MKCQWCHGAGRILKTLPSRVEFRHPMEPVKGHLRDQVQTWTVDEYDVIGGCPRCGGDGRDPDRRVHPRATNDVPRVQGPRRRGRLIERGTHRVEGQAERRDSFWTW